MINVMSEAGIIGLVNTLATFVLSLFILWTRWSLNKQELARKDDNAAQVVKLDDIRRDIKEGTIASHVANLVADKMRIELAATLNEAMQMMGQIQLRDTIKKDT
jgi:hypothetical protein